MYRWITQTVKKAGFARNSSKNQYINRYYNLEKAAKFVQKGNHRLWVGGLWEEIGQLQFDYTQSYGLKPNMRLLDVGCGCLRGGVHFVRYLAPGHYYGIDISQDLLDAGYEHELGKVGLQHKLPRENLLCNGEFDAGHFGIEFDVAIAQSLFTHLPLNHIKMCLTKMVNVVRIGGVFHATAFLSPQDHDWTKPLLHSPANITSYPVDDPYHYRAEDLVYCTAGLPWRFEIVGDWGHPRNQSMVMFTRTE